MWRISTGIFLYEMMSFDHGKEFQRYAFFGNSLIAMTSQSDILTDYSPRNFTDSISSLNHASTM